MTLFSHTTQLTKKTLGKVLAPEYKLSHHKEDEKPAFLLDTFDGELYKKGFLLLESGEQLLLLNHSTGQLLQQQGSLLKRFLPSLSRGVVRNALASFSPIRAFLSLAPVNCQLETYALLDDETKTVARLQTLTISSAKQRVQLLSIKGIRGYTKAYSKLTTALSTLGCHSAAQENIFEQLAIDQPNYIAKPEIILDPNAPIKKSTTQIISTFIEIARHNEAGIMEDHDTEFLHDYRVSLRKVRSVISLFKGVYAEKASLLLKEEFASIMQGTGRLRDLDVYLLDKENYFTLVPATTHEGLNILFDCFEQERRLEHQKVCSELASKGYKKRIKKLQKSFTKQSLDLGAKAKTPSLPFACTLIVKRYKKVCSIARSIDESTPDDTVHELRIQCKKLRYLMEFFIPLFPKKQIKGLIKELKILQDNLGRFNDYSVQQESLTAFLHDNPVQGAASLKVAEAIGALTAMLNLRQQKERHLVMDNFSRFDSEQTRQLFHQTFSL